MFRHHHIAPSLLYLLACTNLESRDGRATATSTPPADSVRAGRPTTAPDSTAAGRVPNELGRIPVLEYHLIADTEGRWERSHERFRRDLETLYQRGYRPVTISHILDRKLDLPRGLSPVVLVFDDASPGQFKYIERNGQLEIDPRSAVGILLDFHRLHPDWPNAAVFCLLPAATEGRSFFGDKGIDGQKTEWRFPKLWFLAERGFELCNHTLWHANLGKYDDAFVQEQIARASMAIDSAVPGYRVRTFALPLGVWPKNRALAKRGSWTDPRTKRTVMYDFNAILQVAGGPTRGPYDPEFDPLAIRRVQVFGEELERALDALDRGGQRYVSDGNPRVVSGPPVAETPP